MLILQKILRILAEGVFVEKETNFEVFCWISLWSASAEVIDPRGRLLSSWMPSYGILSHVDSVDITQLEVTSLTLQLCKNIKQ